MKYWMLNLGIACGIAGTISGIFIVMCDHSRWAEIAWPFAYLITMLNLKHTTKDLQDVLNKLGE